MTIDQFFRGFSPRLATILALILLSQAALVARLWHEQVRGGQQHAERIAKQSVRKLRMEPVRGRIVDRNGKLIADNEPSYDVLFYLHEMRQPRRRGGPTTYQFALATIERTAQVIGRADTVDMAGIRSRLDYHLRVYPALPFRAFEELSAVELARLQAHMPAFPGMQINTKVKRRYPLGAAGAHLIGFVGRRAASLAEDFAEYDYYRPELAGRAGLELAFDERLRGRGGARLMRVDNVGMYHDDLAERVDPVAGDDLVLTLDARAMTIAEQLLRDRRGALVLLDCRTGEVLAMVSSPSYDLDRLDGDTYAALVADEENLPLLNRALGGGYACGSIIKPLIALSALEHGVIAPDHLEHCPGYYQFTDGTRIGCTGQHGDLDLATAIEVSCNTYFIAIGVATNADRLRETLASAGIGQPTGLEVGQSGDQGLLPDREAKRRRTGEPWTAGDTGLISIGQGFIGVSPLQAATYVAAIANGGILLRPRLVKRSHGPDGKLKLETRADGRGQLQASEANLQIIREAMHRVVHGREASARSARTPVIDLAGKTGTAELTIAGERRKNTWFICFGPYESPRFAMAVLVEEGQSGGKTAAPIAREFFESYLAEGVDE